MLGQFKKAVLLFVIIALPPLLLNGDQVFAVNSVVINEVELNPSGSDYSGNEVVELYNPTDNSVDVSGWTVSSVAGKTSTVTIQHGTTIPAKGFLVVGAGSQWLDNSNEGVTLADDLGSVVDSVRSLSDDANDDRTWQRSPDVIAPHGCCAGYEANYDKLHDTRSANEGQAVDNEKNKEKVTTADVV